MGRSSRFDKKEHKISRGLLVVVTVRIITRWLRDEKRRKKKKKSLETLFRTLWDFLGQCSDGADTPYGLVASINQRYHIVAPGAYS